MSRKKYLAESVIQHLEGLTPLELKAHLTGIAHEKLLDLVSQLLMSYRIVARVANLAWAVIDGRPNDALVRALHDYAPNYFPPHQADIEVLIDELEDLLITCDASSRDCIVQDIQRRLAQYQELAARRVALSSTRI
jgi:hypothetical protein